MVSAAAAAPAKKKDPLLDETMNSGERGNRDAEQRVQRVRGGAQRERAKEKKRFICPLFSVILSNSLLHFEFIHPSIEMNGQPPPLPFNDNG